MSGWIKLHRKLLDWEWYSKPVVKSVFIHCLLRANHSDGKWQGKDIVRGTFISSIDKLSSELGHSRQEIRTAIKHLKSTNELTTASGTQHTVFTVINYDSYQGATGELTNEQPTANQRATTNKNDNNENNEKNTNSTPAKKPAGKKFSDDDMKLVEWMIPLIKNVSPKFKQPNVDSWANTIRLMRESDKLDHKYIAQVFKWANQDGFWKTNIMSPAKLREKFAALDAKRLSGNGISVTTSNHNVGNIDHSNSGGFAKGN